MWAGYTQPTSALVANMHWLRHHAHIVLYVQLEVCMVFQPVHIGLLLIHLCDAWVTVPTRLLGQLTHSLSSILRQQISLFSRHVCLDAGLGLR